MKIGKVVQATSLAKSGSAIIDGAEIVKAEPEKAFRRGFEEGVLEVVNKYGARLLLREPEPPRDRLDMLDRVADGWFEEVAAISKGADLRYDAPMTRAAAGARMITNMLRDPGQFAKSIFSSEFKGRVTQRELLQKIDEE